MMVTWVRGHIKNVRGSIEYDPADPRGATVEAILPATELWTGEPARDEHLRHADFLDVDHHPEIRFSGAVSKLIGENHFEVTGDLTIRGITRKTVLEVERLGQWSTPWWEDGVDKGPKLRAGFTASTKIDRREFEVRWNGSLDRNGPVVGNDVFIVLDVEAIREG
jgi:polyisoprenoid-binding protein YceI